MVTMSSARKSRRPASSRAAIASGIASRLLHHFGRKAVRQVVLADHDLDIHAEIVGVAQDLDHAAHRRCAPLRDIRAAPR